MNKVKLFILILLLITVLTACGTNSKVSIEATENHFNECVERLCEIDEDITYSWYERSGSVFYSLKNEDEKISIYFEIFNQIDDSIIYDLYPEIQDANYGFEKYSISVQRDFKSFDDVCMISEKYGNLLLTMLNENSDKEITLDDLENKFQTIKESISKAEDNTQGSFVLKEENFYINGDLGVYKLTYYPNALSPYKENIYFGYSAFYEKQ